jgi:hypothetical protein
MQIHELTQKKQIELEEGILDTIGGAVGKTVSGVKNVGSAIASPFKDIAQGYSTARQDQKISVVADKAFRAWQKYVAQLEQSIAVQPATTTAPVKDDPKDPPDNPPPGGGAAKVDATKDAAAPGAPTTPQSADATARGEQNKGFGFNRDTGVAFNSQAEKDALKAQAGSALVATTPPATIPAKPNYGTQTGAGANVTYNQPIGVPKVNTTQPANAIGPKTPGVTVTTPAKTVASTAPGQPITIGGQKLKPGTKEYDQIANAPLKELKQPAAVSPALAAFRDRTDGKYEAYLTAFVQKNLLSGLGFRGLVNQQEITNAIKAIASPANADPAKQRPLWNDLTRAAALAVPSAGALTGRDSSVAKTSGASGTTAPSKEPSAGEEPAATAEPAKPAMTKAQISQWISRNSEDNATLKAALDAINAVKG